MSTLNENFPSPSLDTDRWNSSVSGAGVSFNVGTPSDGIWPQNVNAADDLVKIDSAEKLIVPGNSDFEYLLYYDNLDSSLAGLERVVYIAWESFDNDRIGEPKYGLYWGIHVKPSSVIQFIKSVRDVETYSTSLVAYDPSSGADGGLKITRGGFDYTLWRYDSASGSWVVMQTITLASSDMGYISFGNYVQSLSASTPPWITGV